MRPLSRHVMRYQAGRRIVAIAAAGAQISFLYASESDAGPYPFGPDTPIEGGAQAGGDRHAMSPA